MEIRRCDEDPRLEKMINLRETDVWSCAPNPSGVFVYSVVIPTISGLGIVGNGLILAVLGGKSLKASTYTYLAGADLITCVELIISGLSRGIFWGSTGWLEYDAFVHLPVGSTSSNIAVLATVCVTLDRLILVSGPLRCKPPKFCDSIVARKIMWCTLPFAIVCNVPYCFIYEYNARGEIVTTEFFNSWWYDVNNWLQLSVFGLAPALFLLIANGFLIFSVGNIIEKRRILMEKHAGLGKCIRERTRLTVTLVGIVFVFLAGELPTHLASRKSAISILYGGDPTKVHEASMERFRIWASVLNAISSSAGFVLYCLLSPQFRDHLKDLVTVVRDGPRRNKLKNCKQPPTIQRLASKQGIDF